MAKASGIFRVDGMTKALAAKLATKKLERFTVNKQQPTPEEYAAEHKKVAGALFEGKSVKPLSCELASPESAKDFMALIRKSMDATDFRDLQIKINVPAQNKSGGIKKSKTGTVAMTWERYDDKKDYHNHFAAIQIKEAKAEAEALAA